MSNILFISTLALNAAGFLFSAIYLWINVFGKFSDISDRNISILKITRVSMILSIVFSFLTSLLSNFENIEKSIEKSTTLFSIVAVTWLVVVAICGLIMLFTVVSKRFFKPGITNNVKQIFKIALPAAIITLILTWLFS